MRSAWVLMTALLAGVTRGEDGLGALAARRGLRFGAAVNGQLSGTDARYRQTVEREYNLIVSENAMKFGELEPARGQFHWSEADSLAAFCARSGIALRGHNLVWHQQSGWLEGAAPGLSRAEMLSILKSHIEQVVGRYRGRVVEWDVVNEAVADDGSGLRDSFWRRRIGDDYIDSAFTWAHRADPGALLFYNDYGGEGDGPKSDTIYALAKRLRARGVPIQGVGLQCHFESAGGFSAPRIDANMKRLAGLGLKVAVTELDLRLALPADSGALQQQRTAYSTLLTTCLANPNCVSFLTWGFTDASSWVPGFFPGQGAALPFDAQYRPKPAYEGLKQALIEAIPVRPGRRARSRAARPGLGALRAGGAAGAWFRGPGLAGFRDARGRQASPAP